MEILVQKEQNRAKVTVRDSGAGIALDVINKVYQGTMDSHRIGLVNVHQRVMLLYGQGLTITRLDPGTEISFYIHHIG